MQLAQFLSVDHVLTNLASRSRDEAVHEILEQLVAANNLEPDQVEPILREIIKRETLGTTAIGREVAVPHARTQELDGTLIGVGLSEEGVDFHALDGQPVRAIFLVLGSQESPDQYIDVMKSISELVQTEDFRRFLWRTDDEADVVELIAEMAD